MRPPISFAAFLKLPEDVQESMGRLPNANLVEELSATAQKSKIRDLEKLLKNHDWYHSFGDHKSWEKGKKEVRHIRSLVDELGDDGMELYRMYGKKNGVMEGFRKEALKDPRPSEYEKHLYKKMKEWGIKDLDELQGEAKVRFHAELDADAPDPVEENKSIFPEQNISTKNIQLGYGEERPVGGKSNHGFCDPGNLYDNTPTWQTPSNERKKRL